MSLPAPMEALRALLDTEKSLSLAYVFGSVARGEARQGSDVDVAVLAEREFDIDMRARLSETLGRGIGSNRVVDVVDLRTAPPLLAAEVVRDGICVLERDPLVRFDFEMEAIRRYEDTRGLRRLQQDLLREGARGRAVSRLD